MSTHPNTNNLAGGGWYRSCRSSHTVTHSQLSITHLLLRSSCSSPVSCWRAGASAAAPSGPRPFTGSCTQAKGEGCECGAACVEWVMVVVVVVVGCADGCGEGCEVG